MRRVLSVLAVVALAALTGCGGGDDDDDEAATATTVFVVVPSTIPVYTGDPDSPFCAVARANMVRIREIGASFVTGGGANLDTLLRDAAPAVREGVGVAPPAIKDDVEVLADGFEALLKSSESGQVDTSIALEPRFQTAAANLTQ
ncbi:MAG TPA: hypothetical protein VM942_09640, partial [Acidimicrobiales bacterium]|nr:hypothetical protein [Acidimicrobiales bacterium]